MRLTRRGRTLLTLTFLVIATLALIASGDETPCHTATSITYWDACR